MRILQLIPAFLLAATTSFVSAATIDARSSADITFSSVPRSGNDAAVQNVVDIISSASKQMEPLNKQLVAAKSAGTPDPAAVSAIVEKMKGVVSNADTQLKAAPSFHPSELSDSAGLAQAVDGLLGGLGLGSLLGVLFDGAVDGPVDSSSDIGSSDLLCGRGLLGIIICIILHL